MRSVRLGGACVLLGFGIAACSPAATDQRSATASATDSAASLDSIPEERPDSVISTPPDSAVMMLRLLPAAGTEPLDGIAQELHDRTVFAPRVQRWFMARMVDGAITMDVGRIDGGVGNSDGARAAFARMLTARSPIQPGMHFTLHTDVGPVDAPVTELRLSGRRIVARLDAPPLDSAVQAAPVEWRGNPAVPLREASPAPRCEPGNAPAIDAAIARYTVGKDSAMSVLRGCFGDFRALIAIRPREITPESVERVILVRTTGGTRSGRLRDLSYPLHELVSVLDINADGTSEIIVHSFRPAMETWAALRMTDSVSFTRFASGFTIEKR